MMQQINLYQDEFRKRRQYTDAAHLGLGLGVVLAVLALVSGGLAWRANEAERRAAALAEQRDALQETLAELQARVQARSADGTDDGEVLARLRRELDAKRRLVDYLGERAGSSRPAFSGYLEGLARSTVDTLWLDRVELADGGRRLRLGGHALEPETVPALLDRLAQRPAFRGHSFRTLRIDRPDEQPGPLTFVLASDRAEAGE